VRPSGPCVRLDAAGSQLVYSTFVGGGLGDIAYACAYRDSSSSLHVSGYSESQDFPITAGAFQGTFQGGYADAFVLRLDF
jgi:hypothetical protein